MEDNPYIIDELDITKWLAEREITASMLHSTLASVKSGSSADELIRYLRVVLVDAQRSKTPIHGKALFDALNQSCSGELESLLIELRNIKEFENTYLWAAIDVESNEAEHQALRLSYVVLLHLLNALDSEFFKWKKGTQWNSLVRIGPGKGGDWSFFIAEPLTFNDAGIMLPFQITLDATADKELWHVFCV